MEQAGMLRRLLYEAEGLERKTASQLLGALLDGGLPELETGAALVALALREPEEAEWCGYVDALHARQYVLPPQIATAAMPVVIPSYHGTARGPNLVPLLAMLLAGFGVPVLVHGNLDGQGRMSTAQVFRELGIAPCTSMAQASEALVRDCLAFVPTAVLAPGLAHLLAVRGRLGLGAGAELLAHWLTPFRGEALHLLSAPDEEGLARIRQRAAATGLQALLLAATEGEAFADSHRRPQLWHCRAGQCRMLFEAEVGSGLLPSALPGGQSVPVLAGWIRDALAGRQAIPMPLLNQLACCLHACGYCPDMYRAKAVVATGVGHAPVL